jgi:hypothetical protein
MRPSRSRALSVLVVGWMGLMGWGRVACGQTGVAAEGALEFVLPTGARTLGMGQAAVASAIGSDGVWWNPAVIARGPREIALHIARAPANVTESDASASVVIPIHRLGAVALSFRYLNLGSYELTIDPNVPLGSAVNTSAILAASFAAPFGDRLSAGLTLKLLRLMTNCTGGNCQAPPTQPTTGAIDFGGQYFLTTDSVVAIGGAVRNIGTRLQVNDAPQADGLPGRAQFGIAYAPKLAQLPKEVRVRAATDIVLRTSGIGGPGYRVGGEVAVQGRYQGRVGYVLNGPTGSGPTFGAGFSTGKLQIDFAQMLSDYASQSGSAPAYLSLRYIF